MKLRDPLTASLASGTGVIALTGCGGGPGGSENEIDGFPSTYTPPKANYDPPTTPDPNAYILNKEYVEPYWVSALTMSRSEDHIPPMLSKYERNIKYSFPDTKPTYDHLSISEWQPATHQMKEAVQNILANLDSILDVSFSETMDPLQTNVITVGLSNQPTTAGTAFFPNNYYNIGMDVIISSEFSMPQFVSEKITNYDYEVLVHELGHALGLKHPFEAVGTSTTILSPFEDNTSNTAMSYSDNPITFDGGLRSLDWMALTKFYGVNPAYNAGDDTYYFSSSMGTFVIDGAGIDTISAVDALTDVIIDLRPGGHSYLGKKSNYITEANQLTISHGSEIENVETGIGNDIVIATNADNVISTGAGADSIFAGDGADTINSGSGSDKIDLSEASQAQDVIKLDVSHSEDLSVDTIYSFVQGISGDIFDVTSILGPNAKLFPLVAVGNVPIGNFSMGILRITGDGIKLASDLLEAFDPGGYLAQLSISINLKALIITSESQSTGVDQNIFHAEGLGEEMAITQLAILKGNTLDIDEWHVDNFSFVM